MEELTQLLSRLSDRHRNVLEWFIKNVGTDQSWPKPLPDGVLLVSRAKGIYKPRWTKYAVSVRQSLGSPYPDRNPVVRPDGTWSYLYFQENQDPKERDRKYTNRGMIECWRDSVPVGVLRQISSKPDTQYRVLGVAIVAGWEEGFFFLEGFSPDGLSYGCGPQAQIDAAVAAQRKEETEQAVFQPDSITDARERITTSIVQRRGQDEFRKSLLEAYGNRCAITGCDAEEALEAVHIVPYRGPDTNDPSNGLLLRADVHTLFDLGLLTIDSSSMTVIVAPRLAATAYGYLAGKQVSKPSDLSARPSKEALDYHRRWTGL